MSETRKTVDLDSLVSGVWAAQIYERRPRFRTGNQIQFPALETGTFWYFLIVFFHVTEIFGTGIRARFPSRFSIPFCSFQIFVFWWYFWFCIGLVADQVEACWQWHNYLVSNCFVRKTILTINIDETYVNFFQGIYKGNLALTTQDLPLDAPPLHVCSYTCMYASSYACMLAYRHIC